MSRIITGNALSELRKLPAESVDCVVTSPPYWGLRDYDHPDQLGLEPDFNDYIGHLCDIFDEVKRVLKPSGTCWVNIGDTYANRSQGGHRGPGSTLNGKLPPEHSARPHPRKSVQQKSLAQIPARFAIAMTDRGWILRNKIIWHKPNCMPASVKDRFTVDYEEVFFFTKSRQYYFQQQYERSKNPDDDVRRITKASDYNRREQGGNSTFNSPGHDKAALREQLLKGRNKRSVWSVATVPFNDAHFAVYPAALIVPMINAGCPPDGVVLDPFLGAGTTAVVARKSGRRYIGIEINPEYVAMAEQRLAQGVLL